MNSFVPLISIYFAVLCALWVVQKPARKKGLRALKTAALVLVVTLCGMALLTLYYFFRPAPQPAKQVLFNGIDYERDVRTSPRPLTIHVVRIDLRATGISFLVTPPELPSGILRAATTSQFLMRYHAQLAINGDFLLPWWSDGPNDFYPREQNPVEVVGISIGNGIAYGYGQTPRTMLVFDDNGKKASIVTISEPSSPFPKVKQALSGKMLLVDQGRRTQEAASESQSKVLHPRVAAGLDKSGRTLLLMVVDGRQPGYSEGVLLSELADILIEHGAYRAMNLDGGGSSAMVMENENGEPEQLNCPIHTRIPRRERPVANHLGVFALPRILPP